MLFNPNRGLIPAPDLDDRTWADLVSDTVALIPQYAPQWTNQGPSDVGITLIELFSWLVEGLTYRLNQVPDKNYIAFLNLLGIKRIPPDPARSFLTFTAAAATVVVPKGTQAQTAATETQAPTIFETDSEVSILPINMQAAIQIDEATSNYTDVSSDFTVPPAPGETITIPAGQTVQLCLGFDNPTTAALNLLVRLFAPITTGSAAVTWVYSQGTTQPTSWPTLSVTGPADGTVGLTQDGTVQLNVPADWASQAPSSWTTPPATGQTEVTSAHYWIGLKIAATTALSLGISWILFNSVSSYSALTIAAPEALGNGNGQPFQTFSLANGPLFSTPGSATPYANLVVQVDGTTWTQVDDIPAGSGQYYQVDPVQSQIMFGNYNELTNAGHGTIPLSTDTIVATTYRYVEAGAEANVGAGTIITLATPVTGISAVTNLFAAYGGSDEQPIDDAKRRAPQFLRNRDRAVTADDYQFYALQASTEVAIAACLPPTNAYGTATYGGLNRSAGNVNLIVVPTIGPDVSVTPQPTPELIQTVAAYLDTRADVTVRLNVTGPRYLPINVTVTAAAWQAAIPSLISGTSDLANYIKNQLNLFFHPVVGGPSSTGWQVGQSVYMGDVYTAIMPPESWGFISQLTIQAGTALYSPSTRPTLSAAGTGPGFVQLADYELVCMGTPTITVQQD
jgi:predicted phage baseplate assembly protein